MLVRVLHIFISSGAYYHISVIIYLMMITCMLISVFMDVEDISLWLSCEASRS